jgi:RHS repeat-associated protein
VAWDLTDRLGSVRNLVDANGSLIDTISYDGYGNRTSESSPGNGDRYGFTARELDSVTGLGYYRGRWYDAQTGRWTSRDPIGFDAGDANLYRYVGNDPTNATDPSGQFLVVRDGDEDMWQLMLARRYGIHTWAIPIENPWLDMTKLGNRPSGKGWYLYVTPADRAKVEKIAEPWAKYLLSETEHGSATFFPSGDNRSETVYHVVEGGFAKRAVDRMKTLSQQGEPERGTDKPLYRVVILTDNAPEEHKDKLDWWDSAQEVQGYHFHVGKKQLGVSTEESIPEQVAKILERFPKGSVQTLTIGGHGPSPGGGVRSMGQPFDANIPPEIATRIAERLSNDATVYLAACDCAKSFAKMQDLADKLQAAVVGATGWVNGFNADGSFQLDYEREDMAHWGSTSIARPRTSNPAIKAIRDKYYVPPPRPVSELWLMN